MDSEISVIIFEVELERKMFTGDLVSYDGLQCWRHQWKTLSPNEVKSMRAWTV